MADSKISALTDGGGLAAGDALAIARSSASYRASPIGLPVLIYRYTVVGSDKASIDTGTDTADAGSNVWSGGDLLEVFMYLRTDETTELSTVNILLNNDGTSIYDFGRIRNTNATVAGTNSLARANLLTAAPGASSASNMFGNTELVCPNYAGTVGNKAGSLSQGTTNQDAANVLLDIYQWAYRSTSAIIRLSIAPNTAGKKFKVGSQLLIYKRLAS